MEASVKIPPIGLAYSNATKGNVTRFVHFFDETSVVSADAGV
jgi:hypothetical protein